MSQDPNAKASSQSLLRYQNAEGVSGALSRLFSKEKQNLPLIFWAAVVGCLAGALGGAFRLVLENISDFRDWLFALVSSDSVLAWLLPIAFVSILLTISLFLVRYFAPETSGSGVQEMEGALDGVRPVRWRRVLPIKFLAGLFSLGGGMVMGREGPTIQMGGAVGAMISEWFKLAKLNRHCLIAAGAAAGLSAAFNAPLAGILFVIEEMRPQFKFNFLSFQSVMVASALADIVVRAMTSQAPVIPMHFFSWPTLSSLWIFIIFGALFGCFGYFFNYFLVKVLDFISSWRGLWRWATGLIIGAAIALCGYFIPGSIGGGYEIIPEALKLNFSAYLLLVLFFVRFATTLVSYGSGAPGGIFAPMLALGTLFGIWFGEMTLGILPGIVDHPGVFAVAGMGALFSATVRAPLTGIALAIEMTGNYSQILPLILTCMSAAIVAEGLGGKPIYSVLLQRTLSRLKKVIAKS